MTRGGRSALVTIRHGDTITAIHDASLAEWWVKSLAGSARPTPNCSRIASPQPTTESKQKSFGLDPEDSPQVEKAESKPTTTPVQTSRGRIQAEAQSKPKSLGSNPDHTPQAKAAESKPLTSLKLTSRDRSQDVSDLKSHSPGSSPDDTQREPTPRDSYDMAQRMSAVEAALTLQRMVGTSHLQAIEMAPERYGLRNRARPQ